MSDELHFVYIIATVIGGAPSAPVKVGITKSITSRFGALQTASPNKLEVYFAAPVPTRGNAQNIEKGFHHVLRKHRLNGEWFDLSPLKAKGYLYIAVGTYLDSVVGMPSDEISSILLDMGFMG